MSASNLHIAWAKLFLRALAASGVRDVVLSPGSRSTPLAVALAESAELRAHVIVDERAAAFFALGQARATGRPSALVCTSGTAGAHYLPAIIEAHESFLPLVAITADRPWELQAASAPQTIDQLKLFGGFVRHFADLGLPDPSPAALAAVPRIAAQATSRALGPTPGPVHVNARFRKPLEPVAAPRSEAWEPAWEALMERGAPAVYAAAIAPDDRAIEAMAARVSRADRGLLVCGPAPLANARARAAIIELARATGFPLLAEGTSQMRFGVDRAGIVVVSAFDALFRCPTFRARHAPDLVLEFGAPPISAGYASFLADHPACPRVVIAPHGWNDPSSTAAAIVIGEPDELARGVVSRLPSRAPRTGWSDAFARADAKAQAIVDASLDEGALGEGTIARVTWESCPEGTILAIGNSTPVRDLDAYCPASSRDVRVIHQRGASGIEGLLAGAAGARSVTDAPVSLLLGDLSLLHDLGSFALLRRADRPLVVVVVQNGGGRIFDHLPIADASTSCPAGAFERFFATPERVDFAHAAAAFDIPFARAETRPALAASLAAAFQRRGPTLIEAVALPGEGARRLRDIWSAVRAELADEPS